MSNSCLVSSSPGVRSMSSLYQMMTDVVLFGWVFDVRVVFFV